MGKKKKNFANKSQHPAHHPSVPQSNWSTAGAGNRLGGSEQHPATSPASSTVAAGKNEDAPAGLQRVRELGDGDCLFHAIARQELGDASLSGKARSQVCDWMQAYLVPSARNSGRCPLSQSHMQMLEDLLAELLGKGGVEGDAAMLRHIQRMRCHGAWGTGLEVMCAAYLYRRPIHVWCPRGAATFQPPLSWLREGATPIRLLHNGRSHWDSAVTCTEDFGEDAALASAIQLSIADFEPDSAESAGATGAKSSCFEGGTFPLQQAIPSERREVQRALAASAAVARQHQEEARGLGDPCRGAKLRQAQEKGTLLGRLAERCESAGETMPLGAGMARIERLKAAADIRAPNILIDGVHLGQVGSSTSSAAISTKDKEPSCHSEAGLGNDSAGVADNANTGTTTKHIAKRWGRRNRDKDSCSEAVAPDKTKSVVQEDVAVGATNVASLPVLRLNVAEGQEDNHCFFAADVQTTSVAALQECIAALQRVGFSKEEAANILETCDGDIEKVKLLYGIYWEDGQTVQVPFI